MADNQSDEHFLVLVPGFMGTKLRDRTTGETVWIDFTQVPLNPLEWEGWLDHLFRTMSYPNDNLEPAGIVDDVVFAPPWIKQEQYSRLLRELESLGYRADPARYSDADLNVYTFGYDWRQDNRVSGRQLGQAIEHWKTYHPGANAWILAHSNGGLVSRWYIEKEGGKEHTGRLILLASPWDGAAKGMRMLFNGLDVLFRVSFNAFQIPERTRQALRTCPSVYQLIPHQDPFLRGPENEAVNPFSGEDWLDDPRQRELLADGYAFNQELGTNLSVDTLVFFGRKKSTTTQGIVNFGAGARWSSIQWVDTEEGDGTLPERSAVFASAHQNIPVIAGHGDIYVNPALFEILTWELVDKYAGRPRAAITADRVAINFVPDRDVYGPGEQISLRASVNWTADGSPVSGATINVQMAWRGALPGSEPLAQPENLPQITLLESGQVTGRYNGAIVAPLAEGYYQLTVTVLVPLGKPVDLQELIVVESSPR